MMIVDASECWHFLLQEVQEIDHVLCKINRKPISTPLIFRQFKHLCMKLTVLVEIVLVHVMMEVEEWTSWHVFVEFFDVHGHVIDSHVFAKVVICHQDNSVDFQSFGMLSQLVHFWNW